MYIEGMRMLELWSEDAISSWGPIQSSHDEPGGPCGELHDGLRFAGNVSAPGCCWVFTAPPAEGVFMDGARDC